MARKRRRSRGFAGFAGTPQEHARSAWVALNDLGDHTRASAKYTGQGDCEGGFAQLQYAAALKYAADQGIRDAGAMPGRTREWAKGARADYNTKRAQFDAVEKEFIRTCLRKR